MEDVARAFADLFPIQSERFLLEFVPESVSEDSGEVSGGVREDGEGNLRATLRTIAWEIDGDARSIRDVKEQEVVWLYGKHRDDPRVPAYLAGWAAGLRFVLARYDELHAAGALPGAGDRLEFCMPYDLLHPGVLDLRRPKTEDEFVDALLSSKKRLGALLP